MREWCDALLALLLAPSCAACQQLLRRPTRGCVCDGCWNAVVSYAPSQRRRGPPLAAVAEAAAIGPYEGALRAIIHALKYDGRRTIAARLARTMGAAAGDLVREADRVVPVPLHPARRRARGFNQAADLARHLGPPLVHALTRTRNTPTQTALPADARRANMANAFRVTRHAAVLRGATVLLVDDVQTTGATLDGCAAALLHAGVARVLALTAARVETAGS